MFRKIVAAVFTVGLVGVVTVVGVVVGPASSASALCDSSISVECQPANLPILIEAGLVAAPPTAGGVVAAATMMTVASGGVAGLGTFNAAIGVVGATTLLATGAAVTTGLLTQHGLQDGVTLKTAPTSGTTEASPCPTSLLLDSAAGNPSIPGANCRDVPFSVRWGEYTSNYWHPSGSVADVVKLTGVVQVGSVYTFTMNDVGPTGTGATRTYLPQCLYVDPAHVAGAMWATNTSNQYSSIACSATRTDGSPAVTRALKGFGFRASWDSSNNRLYQVLWTPDFQAGSNGWHGTIRSTVTCTGPGGDHPVAASKTLDLNTGADLPVPAVSCPTGELATAVAIEFLPLGQTNWIPLTGGTTPGTVKALVSQYPDCFGPGVSPCSMELQTLGGSGQWESCGKTAEYCPDWVRQVQTAPTRYRCQYGSYTLDVTYCSAFRKPGTLLPNVPPAEDPATPRIPLPINAPLPQALPLSLVDPVTGSTVPTTALDPESSSEPSECWPTGWGVFNPLAWVYMPVGCALRAAFIPRPQAVTKMQTDIAEEWEVSAPGRISAVFINAPWPQWDTSCAGITVSLAWMKQGAFSNASFPTNLTLLKACQGDPLQPWAAGSTLFLSVAAVFLIFKTWPALIGKMFNYTGVDG